MASLLCPIHAIFQPFSLLSYPPWLLWLAILFFEQPGLIASRKLSYFSPIRSTSCNHYDSVYHSYYSIINSYLNYTPYSYIILNLLSCAHDSYIWFNFQFYHEMSIQIQKENALLNQYVIALQSQLKVRQQEKVILQERVRVLKNQYNCLIDDISNPEKPQYLIQQTKTYQRDLIYLQSKYKQVQKRLEVSMIRKSGLQFENTRLNSNLKVLRGKIDDLQLEQKMQRNKERNQNDELQQLKKQKMRLKESVNNMEIRQNEIKLLQMENSNLISTQKELKNMLNNECQQIIMSDQTKDKYQSIRQQFYHQKCDELHEIKQKYRKSLQLQDRIIKQLKNKLKKEEQNTRVQENQTIALRNLKIYIVDLNSRIMLGERLKHNLKNQIRSLQLSLKDKQLNLITKQKSFSQLYKLHSLFSNKCEETLESQKIIASLRQKTKQMELKLNQLQKEFKLAQQTGIKSKQKQKQQNSCDKETVQSIKIKIQQNQSKYNEQLAKLKTKTSVIDNQNAFLKQKINQFTKNNAIQTDLKTLIQKLRTQLRETQQKIKVEEQKNEKYKNLLSKNSNFSIIDRLNSRQEMNFPIKNSGNLKKEENNLNSQMFAGLNSGRSITPETKILQKQHDFEKIDKKIEELKKKNSILKQQFSYGRLIIQRKPTI